jgi:putative endonuclease
MSKTGYVYILSSKGKRLYTGVTSDLQVRVKQHKKHLNPTSHTAKYNIDQLVYYEVLESIQDAINRETSIKNMHRLEKIRLIVSRNPDWTDLSLAWGKPTPPFDESKLRPSITF